METIKGRVMSRETGHQAEKEEENRWKEEKEDKLRESI